MSKLNPSAKPFSFNPGASSFTPGGSAAPAPAAEAKVAPDPAEAAPAADAKVAPAPAEPIKESWDEEEAPPTAEELEEMKRIEEEEAAAEELNEATKAMAEATLDDTPTNEEQEEMDAIAAAEGPKTAKRKKNEIETTIHDSREHLNIVFIGHVDAGKSTISGQILLLTAQVDERTIAKYEKEAKEKNRESWYLAYIMDTNEEERAKGKTVEVGRAHFETPNKRYTLLDAPGHKNYVPNMIEGTAQADVGVLVISARKGEFETGFDRGGQTREHAMLAKTLGIQRLIILINKMDDPSVKWSKERYDQIEGKLTPFLKRWGYNIKNEVIYIPGSGLTGANIKDKVKSSDCPWYKGPSLMELLDQLRIPIIARYKDMGTVCILGKQESGTIRVGDKLMMQPGMKQLSCVGLMIDDDEVTMAGPGENVVVKVKGAEEEDISGGFVLSHADSPTKTGRVFLVQIAVLDLLEHKPLITAGYTCILHIHSLAIECQVASLVSAIDRKTGKPDPKRPRFLKSGSVGTVKITVEQSIAIETFKDYAQMGRFTLRDEGVTICIGKVLKVKESK